ncbi:MAG: YkgJ family cysteine cluster protein [Gemmatimonadota bacterium]|nr:YkgJ family cysteine cluster protein [Gemmatimonadota bacterium]
MQPATLAYQTLLQRVDRWFEQIAERHPGVIPCRSGCSACCHGPFDISTADVLLLQEGLALLPPAERAAARDRAEAIMEQMQQIEPGWQAPFDVRALGEDRFDALTDALAAEPCPLLDAAGRCQVYAHRPIVCRLIGLPMVSAEGNVLENACPIQEDFPAYAALDPQLFDLESLEAVEKSCLGTAAEALLGDSSDAGFETVIAAVVAQP